MRYFGPMVMLEQARVYALAGASTLAVMLLKPQNPSQTFPGGSSPDAPLEMFGGVADPSRRKGWRGRAEAEGGTPSRLDVFNTAIAG